MKVTINKSPSVTATLSTEQKINVSISSSVFEKAQENLYELALADGFEGSISEFLESLKGEEGVTFTPSVTNGTISWSNDKNLTNPEPVVLIDNTVKRYAIPSDYLPASLIDKCEFTAVIQGNIVELVVKVLVDIPATSWSAQSAKVFPNSVSPIYGVLGVLFAGRDNTTGHIFKHQQNGHLYYTGGSIAAGYFPYARAIYFCDNPVAPSDWVRI